MDIHQTILSRRSIRRFTDQKVSKEQLSTLMTYAMAAPSACNMRPWEFYIITKEEVLVELRKASRFTNYQSPCNIVVAGNLHHALPLQLASYWIQDCSAAIENILLGATSLGLGACWCGLLPQKRPTERVRALLSLPEYIIPLAIIHLGYPAQERSPHEGYDEEKVHWIK